MAKQIPIIVINLKKDTDKKSKIIQRLNDLNLEFSFFNAIYGVELSPEELSAAYNPQHSIEKGLRAIKKNEIGCALSHLGVYKKMLDDNIDKMIILEDDAILDKEFVEALDIIEYLPDNWELFLFGYSSKRSIPCNFNVKLKSNPTTFNVGVSPIPRGCLHAYVVNQKGAKRMLSYKKSMYQPIDRYSGDYRLMNVYTIYPRVAKQDADLESSIGYDWMKETGWKQQKIIKAIRRGNNNRRAKRQASKSFSLSCLIRKIKFKIRHGFKEYYQ